MLHSPNSTVTVSLQAHHRIASHGLVLAGARGSGEVGAEHGNVPLGGTVLARLGATQTRFGVNLVPALCPRPYKVAPLEPNIGDVGLSAGMPQPLEVEAGPK